MILEQIRASLFFSWKTAMNRTSSHRETWKTRETWGGILCGTNDESYRELQRPIETGVIIIIIMNTRECAQLEQSAGVTS